MAIKLNDLYTKVGQAIGTFVHAPSRTHMQCMLFILGVVLLGAGLAEHASAALDGTTTYNDVRIADSTNAVLLYLEGSFGALVMVASGIGAILSAAFGQYRAALGLMVVAIGAFILRSLMSTFFNDQHIRQ